MAMTSYDFGVLYGLGLLLNVNGEAHLVTSVLVMQGHLQGLSLRLFFLKRLSDRHKYMIRVLYAAHNYYGT